MCVFFFFLFKGAAKLLAHLASILFIKLGVYWLKRLCKYRNNVAIDKFHYQKDLVLKLPKQ